MASISLTGLATNDPIPGNYVEVNFAQGPASSGTSDYQVILLGNRLSSGSALDDGYIYGPDTDIPLASEADAIQLFGAGSELHRMVRRFLKVNKSTSLYACPVKESVGAKATGVIAISGTATASATLRTKVGDEIIDAPVFSGDSPTVIAQAVVAAVNAVSSLPVVASNIAGSVTLEAKQRGLRGNFIRFSARVLNPCGVSVTPTAKSTALTGGTTADSIANALDTISSRRFYYIVPAAEDATQVGALAAQIDSVGAPIVGLRQRAVIGSVDSLANATSIAVGLNKARCELVWQQSSDLCPSELAANAAAVYSLEEVGASFRCNFSGYGTDAVTSQRWFVRAPSAEVVPTRAQLKSALNNGITPITSGKFGATYLVKRITTRSLNGSTPDYRIRDSHKVTVADRFADDLLAKQVAQMSGKMIGNDPLPGQPTQAPNVVTPKVLRALIISLLREYESNGLLEEVAETIKNLDTRRESSPNTRLSARIPLDPADILDQTASAIDQVG